MKNERPTVLCVDDEVSILHALKRVLRKEDYRLLTATTASEGLKILSEENVHLVISDQRMPGIDGVMFLKKVKETYPDIIRITLTGYMDVDTIKEAVNQGHIYKFLLKPWNDENLILEIRQALKQYELMEANRELNNKIMAQNEELKHLNDRLESLVKERTEELIIRNKALELEQAVLSDLPVPILGLSSDGMIAMTNYALDAMFKSTDLFEVGGLIDANFPEDTVRRIKLALSEQHCVEFETRSLGGVGCIIHCVPLSGNFRGQGMVLAFRKI